MTAPTAAPTIDPQGDAVFLIDTGLFRSRTTASYLVRGSRTSAFIEVGAATSAPRLLAALDVLGVSRDEVGYVIVTHVHLDHAGGAGTMMQELPAATLVVHPRGSRHLIDPTKLIAGATVVYGEEALRTLYGPIVPVAKERVVDAADGYAVDLGGRTLLCRDAPGHAKHHLVVYDDKARGVFAGDAFGLAYPEIQGARGALFFPTTSPSQLDPEALHRSIDMMLALRPAHIFLTHYGALSADLDRWGATLHAYVDKHVELATRVPAGPSAHAEIVLGLQALLLEAALAQGVRAGREDILAAWAVDLELNAQGLEAWREHR
ncbi:MAG: MBL fold metallo-hydrolase [Deltaproteobacteria bacterium]|nr:MBL fold metallo-hydrolase [Deltaproteobacteria bacterium]